MATGEGRLGGRTLPRSVSSSDTFCRVLGELLVGETSTSGCSRTLSEPTRGLDNASGRADDAAISREDRLTPSPATGRAIRCAQGVFRSREFLDKVLVPTRRAGREPSPPGDWASLHRLFPICGKGARAFFILRHALLGRSKGMCRSRTLRDIGSRPIRLLSARSAPGLLRSDRKSVV